MLRDLNLQPVYRTEDDNILEDFYIPALSESVLYRRAVGFFSARMLSYAAQGISALIENNGRIQLIFGGEISGDDANAIEEGYKQRHIIEQIGEGYLKVIESIADKLCYERLEALSWLVATGRLELKLALRKQGMYHEKIGIMTDHVDDFIVFQGSVNETPSALLPEYNFESLSVYPGWDEQLKPYYEQYVAGFDRLWSNTAKDTAVVPFPQAAKQKLIQIAERISRPPSPDVEKLIALQARDECDYSSGPSIPKVPERLGGNEFKIRPHQTDALNSWRNNGFRGILALATGSGKTITAIYGAVRMFEATKRMALVIAVPYQNLADQWCEVLSEFNIHPIRCYGSRDSWEQTLLEELPLFQSDASQFLCLVVVNRTLTSDHFQKLLKSIPGDELMWVGDECHHHSSVTYSRSLPQHAKLRLGLSATPEHYIDGEANKRLTDFYDNIVSEFTLADALKANVITPYEYHVHVIELTFEESEEYIELSKQISKRMAWNDDSGSIAEDQNLKSLLMKRSRLLGSAANKLVVLDKLMASTSPQPLTLFYCGDGSTEEEDSGDSIRQVESISRLLHKHSWKTSRFTSRESRRERQDLLDHFRVGDIEALVAIRCLDEGIDVPACRAAYLLASARNPRQFIQRRGRILRKDTGKKSATIHDFLVTLCQEMDVDGAECSKALLENEMARVAEFASLSLNSATSIKSLSPIVAKYGLQHLLLN